MNLASVLDRNKWVLDLDETAVAVGGVAGCLAHVILANELTCRELAPAALSNQTIFGTPASKKNLLER